MMWRSAMRSAGTRMVLMLTVLRFRRSIGEEIPRSPFLVILVGNNTRFYVRLGLVGMVKLLVCPRDWSPICLV
jgi:hypothetical protein